MNQPGDHPAINCRHCPDLIKSRHQVVWGRGPAQAQIMAIAESPGAEEDTEGIPFVGRASRELAKEFKASGIAARHVHIANLIMCHPEDNRDPTPDEIANCSPWLTEHIRIVNPRMLILFGKYSITNLSATTGRVADTEGLMYRWMCDDCGGRDGTHLNRYAETGEWIQTESCKSKMVRRLVVFVYHPASVLRGNPENHDKIVHQLKRGVAELKIMMEADQ